MLVQLIVGLIVLGILLWLINNYLPMDGKIKQLINIVAIVGAVIWVLQAFGILGMGGPLTSLIVTLAILGVVLWAINTYIPMDGKIKGLVNVVVVVVAVLVVLQSFGMLPIQHAMLR